MQDLGLRRQAPLTPPTDLESAATRDFAAIMNAILTEAFALHLKMKKCQWQMGRRNHRDYDRLLGEHAGQLFALADPIAELIRKAGGTTLKSAGHLERI